MAVPPRGVRISRENLDGAPDWVDPLLNSLNPFMSDVTSALQGGLTSDNLHEQIAQVQIQTSGNPDDTFKDSKVQIKNQLDTAPKSVQIIGVSARFSSQVVNTSLLKKHTVGATGEPAFEGTWAAGSPTPRFWMDPWGYVHMDGALTGGVLATSAFTLPASYRPEVNGRFPTDSNGAYGAVVVNATGTVVPTIGATATVYLNSVTFRAANDFGLAVGLPIWTYNNNKLIEIKYIPGLRPNTVYDIAFLIR